MRLRLLRVLSGSFVANDYQMQHGNKGWQMRKHIWARLAILLATVSTLSGCIWWPYEEGGGRGGGYHEEHRGGDEGGRR